MKNVLKCTLTLAAGVLALALPTLAGGSVPIPHVPEPATFALLAGGLVAVIGARKLRKG
jgi:hypothetical protein